MHDAGYNLVVEFKELRKMDCRQLENMEIAENSGFDVGDKFCNTGRLRPMVEFHGKRLAGFVDMRDLQNSEMQWLVKMESPLIFSRKNLQAYLKERPGHWDHILQFAVAEAMLRKCRTVDDP